MSKILVLDIETSPHTGFHWGLWQQNISINQLVESSTVLCWAAKWVGEKQVHFASIMESTPKQMITKIHKLVDEADAIITYNGKRFDMPTLNREFLLHKLPPPSPYKDIDLLQTARNKFKFASNKLDYVAQELGVGQKTSHEGMPLWIECMSKNPKAWRLMKKYNCNDVKLTEEVYTKLLGWIVTPFNHNTHKGHEGHVCPSCGGSHIQKRGYSQVGANSYQRYQCIDCGKWSQSNKAVKELKKENFLKSI
jgi:DNA polymerase elongation subunit (family B)